MSDSAVVNLRSEIRNPSSSDVIVKTFINRKEASYYEDIQKYNLSSLLDFIIKELYEKGENINYKLFKHHQLMLRYIDWIAPLPINYLSNPNEDKKVSFFIQDLSKNLVNSNPKIKLDEKQEKYHDSRKESVRRKNIIYTDYHRAALYMSNLEHILVRECPEYFTALTNERHERDSINDKNYRQKNLTPLISQQCQFCSRIRWYKKLKTGSVKLSCENQECEERQTTWVQHIKRMNTLRESTLKKGR